MTKKKQDLQIAETLVKRSNDFIGAKFKSTLLEKKLILIGISRVKREADGTVKSRMRATEIRDMLGLTGKNIYKQLKELSYSVIGHHVLIENDDQTAFKAFNVIQKCEYDGGEFVMTFDSEMQNHIITLKKPFTVVSLETMLSFKSNYSYRLYELLKRHAYLLDKTHSECVTATYSLIELRFDLGLINQDEEVILGNNKMTVEKALQKGYTQEEVFAVCQTKLFERWGNFKARVLEVGRAEVNNSTETDIKFEYNTIKGGKGGAVEKITFLIFKNPKYNTHLSKGDSLISKAEQGILIEQVAALMEDEPITTADVRVLLDAASWIYSKVEDAYNLAKNQSEITNLVGWMKKAIVEEWANNESIVKINGQSYDKSKEINDLYEDFYDPENYKRDKEIWENERKNKRKINIEQLQMDFDEPYSENIDRREDESVITLSSNEVVEDKESDNLEPGILVSDEFVNGYFDKESDETIKVVDKNKDVALEFEKAKEDLSPEEMKLLLKMMRKMKNLDDL